MFWCLGTLCKRLMYSKTFSDNFFDYIRVSNIHTMKMKPMLHLRVKKLQSLCAISESEATNKIHKCKELANRRDCKLLCETRMCKALRR